MSIIDRHILSECFKAFAVIFVLTLGVVLIIDIQDDLPDFIRYEATSEIFRYYFYYIPSFLPLIVPISFLISLLFALSNLHRHNEIIAMRTAGLSLFRIMRSLWLVGLALSLLLLYLNAIQIPYSVERSRAIFEEIRFTAEEKRSALEDVGLMFNTTFHNHKEQRLWVLNRYSQRTNQGFGVNVYQLDSEGREVSRVMAHEGIYFPEDGHWVMRNGREITFNPDNGEAVRSLSFKERAFENFTDTPDLMKIMNKDPSDLSLRELSELMEKVPPKDNPHIVRFAVRHYSILANPFFCLVIVGIAIPFAVSGVRSSPAVRVSKSVGLFAVYYVISNLSYLLGGEGMIDPQLSAWLPIMIMSVVALFLFKKAA